jgi:hypothetical protein
MRKIIALPVAAIVAVGLVACSDDPSGLAPEGPSFELVDEGLRIDHDDASHFVFAAFIYEMGGGSAGRVLTDGEPGIVPGNLKHHGWCWSGTWHNPQNKPTSGDATKPHPFCYEPGSAGIQVVLERIAAVYEEKTDRFDNITHKFLYFTKDLDEDEYSVKFITNANNQQGSGEIEARAVNAANGDLVGHIEFDLEQFDDGPNNDDLFDCELTSEDSSQDGCLNRFIDITFRPIIGVDGGGDPLFGDDVDFDEDDEVFLYWVPKADVLGS